MLRVQPLAKSCGQPQTLRMSFCELITNPGPRPDAETSWTWDLKERAKDAETLVACLDAKERAKDAETFVDLGSGGRRELRGPGI